MNTTTLGWVSAHWLPLFVSYWFISGAISNMEAPTKDSSAFYRWFFRYTNWIVANWKRGASAAIEQSPNFKDALSKITVSQINCPNCGQKIFNGSTSNGGTNAKT